MATWQFGGFAPNFVGPDQSPYSILQTFSGTVLDVSGKFTLDFGTKSYSDQGGLPTGVSFNGTTGKYTAAGAVTPGTYAMITRCSGSDTPPSYTDYSWQLIVNAAANAPVFSGPIDDQIHEGDFTFDVSGFATGETSYSVSALPTGITFNTGTGIFTIVSASSGFGLFGPFTVTYTNATGSTPSNPFFITVLIPAGSSTPVFIGPDFSPLNLLQTDVGSRDLTALFTLAQGTKSYSDVGAATIGVAFANGIYSWAGAITPGAYAKITRCSGSIAPVTSVDYSWTLNVSAVVVGIAPVFTGPINNQTQSVDFTFNVSGYATGQTSYSVGALPAGITFNTGTGLFTINATTTGLGAFGPFIVTYTNSTGSTDSNAFTITITAASGGGGDFSDATLQALLDPQGNFNGIRIIIRNSPVDMSKVCYYVVPNQRNRGQAKWVEVLATDDAVARANKIILATTIASQPIWPLPT